MEFHLLLQIFRAFENWKHFPCHRAKIYLKKAGFSAFLSHGKFRLVKEKSADVTAQFLCEFWHKRWLNYYNEFVI